MVHHRIQKKKRNKLKSVDPFNTASHQAIDAKQKGKNIEPRDVDDQPITRKQKELFEGAESVAMERTFPRKKRKTKDLVRNEVIKGGFVIRDFYNRSKMINQVHYQTAQEVQEQRLLARFGLAGRDKKEIAADYAKMDMMEQERLQRKKQLREAIKSKNLKQKQRQKAGSTHANDKGKRLDKQKDEVGKDVNLSSKSALQKSSNRLSTMSKDHKRKEMLLNAKEVIPFGSRVDAPPTLSSVALRTQKSFRRPGMKPLLLKGINEQSAESHESSKKIGVKHSVNKGKTNLVLAAERQKVIEAYRNLKKERGKFV